MQIRASGGGYNTTYDFVLPRKDEKFKMSPNVPEEIIQLYVFYFLTHNQLTEITNIEQHYFEDFELFPKATATLNYVDIGGKKHKKKFQPSFSISADQCDLLLFFELDKHEFEVYAEFSS